MNTFSRRAALLILSAAFLAALTASARATIRAAAASLPAGSVPSTINYQGRLVDNGFPVTGIRQITFRLYDDLAAGTLLQSVPTQQVDVSQGLFATTISLSTTALAGPLQKYLEVQVGSQVLTPREPLQSVPYALVAKSLEENLEISTVSVGTQLISSGTLSVASIQALNGSSYFSIISPVHMSSATLILDGNAATSLTTTGSVGVGTGSPGRLLTLNGAAGDTHALLQNNGTGTGLTQGLDLIETTGGSAQLWNYQNGVMQFATNNTERMRIDATGQVGIGATIPGAKLDVDGGAQFGNPGSKSVFSTAGALSLAANAGLTMSGANLSLTGAAGNIVNQASVTASAFFGDGASVTNVTAAAVPASGVTGGTFQNSAYTFQNTVNFPGSGVWNSSGNLGLGTVSAPASKLHMSSGTLTIDGNTAVSIVTTGNVGIKGAPTNPLSVTGNANVTGTLTAGNFSGPISGNATTATSLANGAANQIPYQTSANNTSFVGAGGNATVLRVPNAGGAPAFGAVDLSQANATTSQLPTSRGGSGQDWSAVAQGALPFFNGAGTMSTLAPSTAGKVLQTNGAGSNPTWASPAVGGATTLTSGTIWVGANVTNIATERTVSGNATLSNTGVLAITSLPAISGANLTSLTAANISAGTAGINISGNAATVTTNANLTGNVTSVGNATTIASIPAVSGANLTSLTAANISAGTAGINISGNAATATSATSATTAARLASSALAGFIGTAPAALGAAFYCSDCTTSAICVSTGTLAGQWSDAAGRATACK